MRLAIRAVTGSGGHAELRGHLAQLAALAGHVVLGMIGHVQLDHALAQLLKPVAVGLHLHARRHQRGAGGREAALAFDLLGASREVEDMARAYFGIRIWGAPATLGTFVQVGVLIAQAESRKLLLVKLFQNGLNIAHDSWLAGVMQLGAAGIALGTLIAEWSAFLFALALVWRLLWRRRYPAAPFIALTRLLDRQRFGVLLTANTEEADLARRELSFFCGETTDTPIYTLPDWETLPYDNFSAHQDIVSDRLSTLYHLPKLRRGILILPLTSLMHRLSPKAFVQGNSLVLQVKSRFDTETMRQNLLSAGYQLDGVIPKRRTLQEYFLKTLNTGRSENK